MGFAKRFFVATTLTAAFLGAYLSFPSRVDSPGTYKTGSQEYITPGSSEYKVGPKNSIYNENSTPEANKAPVSEENRESEVSKLVEEVLKK